jgi:hypothetical protein
LLVPTFYNPRPFSAAYLGAKWLRKPLNRLLGMLEPSIGGMC